MKGNRMSNQIDVAHSIQGVSKGRPDGDFYPTPPYATQELLKREVFCGSIYEPACGDGAISEVLKDIYIQSKRYIQQICMIEDMVIKQVLILLHMIIILKDLII